MIDNQCVTGRNMIDGVSDPTVCRQQGLKIDRPVPDEGLCRPGCFSFYFNTESLSRLCWSRPVMVSALTDDDLRQDDVSSETYGRDQVWYCNFLIHIIE